MKLGKGPAGTLPSPHGSAGAVPWKFPAQPAATAGGNTGPASVIRCPLVVPAPAEGGGNSCRRDARCPTRFRSRRRARWRRRPAVACTHEPGFAAASCLVGTALSRMDRVGGDSRCDLRRWRMPCRRDPGVRYLGRLARRTPPQLRRRVRGGHRSGPRLRETFQEFRPGFDLYAERERRARAGQPETFGEEIGLGEGCGGPLARLSGRLREQGAAEGGVRDRCWVQGGGATDQ